MAKQILISHPTGNANSRATAEGFCRSGMLESFHTCIALFPGTILYKIAIGPLKILRRRTFAEILKSKTITHPVKEFMRMIAPKIHKYNWIEHEKGSFCVDNVYIDMDSQLAKYLHKNANKIDAVYAYEDCAVKTFTEAKKLQKTCIFDLPIGYWRSMQKLLGEERDKNPDWAQTLGTFNDSQEKLMRKDEELRLADRIYVASSFTKKTLNEYPGKLADIEVVPYGFPPVNNNRVYQPFDGRKIKLLFVGGLSQRKGLSYLFDAVKGLEDKIELTVIGRGNVSYCPTLQEALKTVNYIESLPHDQILKTMAESDLLIFPSLFEGFGLVVTEAMSQGTPVIATDRTCAPDIITDGIDGWIVEAGESTPIRALLQKFISDPQILIEAGKRARETAEKRPWKMYEQQLATSVKNYLDGQLS